jgi:hypothetical protein
VAEAIGIGETDARDILAAVTPGGGKSLLPVIAASRLIAAGVVDRICVVVPGYRLRLRAEEAFAGPYWRDALGHALLVRAADNTPDPSRGMAGYVTTYQGIAAAPDLHLAEFRRHRTLLVVDEVHHLPALADTDPVTATQTAETEEDQASAWSRAMLPLLECASLRLLLSGTLERANGKGILWLPYRKGPKARTREVELDAPGWTVVGYSRAQALAEWAVPPVTFGALDGKASWRDEDGHELGPHRLASRYPDETTRLALFTALRTAFAEADLAAFGRTRNRVSASPTNGVKSRLTAAVLWNCCPNGRFGPVGKQRGGLATRPRCFGSYCDIQKSMPPMPPGPPAGGDVLAGRSATIASVVISREATEAAPCRAVRTTLVGSMMPASTRFLYSSVWAS